METELGVIVISGLTVVISIYTWMRYVRFGYKVPRLKQGIGGQDNLEDTIASAERLIDIETEVK